MPVNVAYAALLLLLLAALGLGPGFSLVRRLRWGVAETLCASIGLSLVLLYLAAAAIYALGVDWRWCWLATTALTGLAASSRGELRAFLRKRQVRRLLAAFGFLLAVGLALLSLVRHSSGGMWSGDSVEHYQRTLFFLQRLPDDTLFIDRYPLPARPPLMNLVSAYVLGHAGDSGFDLYQVVFLFLNLLVYFPCALLAGLAARHGGRRTWLLAAVLATSPVVLQNATWAWTKLFAAFFVILSVALYVRGWRRRSTSRIVGAAASMAAAVLVHYSAGPFALVLCAHYALVLLRERRRPAEALGSAGLALALLVTWFAWSLAVWGPATTILANTTVGASQWLSWTGNLGKVGGNVVSTIIPHPLRLGAAEFEADFWQPNRFGFVRDYAFMVYQVGLPFALGSTGWLAALALLRRLFGSLATPQTRFWAVFCVLTALLGIAAHGPPDRYGVAHVSLQPLVLMGLTLLAAGFPTLPRWARRAVAVSMVADVALGVLLHFRMQMLDIRMLPVEGTLSLPFSRGLLNPVAVVNAIDRQQRSFVYWGDHFAGVASLVLGAAVLLLGIALLVIAIAAAGGERGGRHHPRTCAAGILALHFAAAAACFADRAAGYSVAPAPAHPDGPTRRLDDALAPRLQAVLDSPDSSRAWYELGLELHRKAGVAESAGPFLEAFLLDPGDVEARYALQLALAPGRLGLEDTAAHSAEEVRRFPRSAAAHAALAEQLARRGHGPAAQRHRDEAARLSRDGLARSAID